MFKLLVLFPLMLVAGALLLAGVPLLFALLPVLLAVGAGIFAIVLVFAVLGLFFRLFAGLLIGVGWTGLNRLWHRWSSPQTI